MPRKSKGSEESPVPRRVSARIAAAQAASPAKTPHKSPRKKRLSSELKNVSEDADSQLSQLKSETSVDDVNGVETSSSLKDVESVSDVHDAPSKPIEASEPVSNADDAPAKSLEVTVSDVDVADAPMLPVKDAESVGDAHDAPVKRPRMEEEFKQTTETDALPSDDKHESASDFEIIEKDSVPPSDSAEVKQAVEAQGEDGDLLANYVQVSKDDIPEFDQEQPFVHHSEPEAGAPVEKAKDATVVFNGQSSESKHSDIAQPEVPLSITEPQKESSMIPDQPFVEASLSSDVTHSDEPFVVPIRD